MRPALIAALAVLTAAAGAATPAVAAAGTTVTLKDTAFQPAKVTIRAGQSVTWVWDDALLLHNVTSVGLTSFAPSPSMRTGRYRVRFTKRGTYRYVCTIHYGMNGRITVR